MKRLMVIGSIVLALAVVGCDLFGKEDTRIYVWGMIYEDVAFETPAPGVTVYLRGDSTTVYNQSVQTDGDGRFFFEAQVYPSTGEAAGGVGYTMDELATFGLEATYNGNWYIYADFDENPFTLGIGDTLRVEDISLQSFGGGGGK
ncbi:MAG: hypothetical protein ACQETZ_06025 [Candidatus Fermentibacterota bacterium]